MYGSMYEMYIYYMCKNKKIIKKKKESYLSSLECDLVRFGIVKMNVLGASLVAAHFQLNVSLRAGTEPVTRKYMHLVLGFLPVKDDTFRLERQEIKSRWFIFELNQSTNFTVKRNMCERFCPDQCP